MEAVGPLGVQMSAVEVAVAVVMVAGLVVRVATCSRARQEPLKQSIKKHIHKRGLGFLKATDLQSTHHPSPPKRPLGHKGRV